MNFSAGASEQSMMKIIRSSKSAMSLKNRASSMGESSTAKAKPKIPPKPEPMTDKQIVKKLNNEVLKSKIFQRINIRNLPDRIVRREVVDKNLFRKKTGGLELKQEEGLLTIAEESDNENQHSRKKRVDYFLERQILGDHHIGLARD